VDDGEIKPRKEKLIHIRLSPRTHYRLKVWTAEKNVTIQAWVSRAIRQVLRRQRILARKAEREKVASLAEPVSDQPKDGPKDAKPEHKNGKR
jgi:hypothetical protein